jgi:NAD(P)H-dependent FMN reductase
VGISCGSNFFNLEAFVPTLTVVIGSTRTGRAGLPVAQWFVDRARNHGGFDVLVVDLADLDLPIFDEPNHPRLRQYVHDHTKRLSAMRTTPTPSSS